MTAIARSFTAAVLAAFCSAAFAQSAADFPSKRITAVIGYPAGGPTDVMMRALAPRLSAEWKQPIVVENRAGANEAIGAAYVAKAPPDGHTLMLATEVPLTMNPFLYSQLQYDPQKDFTPVSLLLTSPLTLVVPANSPANTLQEFIALAKSRAGSKPLPYASAGPGGVLHLPMAMFAKQNGVEMTHVPYKGVAPILTDLVSGEVAAAWVAVAGAAPYVKDGRLKALVVGAPARVKALPQVPVFSETSVAPVQADFIFAMVAPAGTPAPIAEKIAAAIRRHLSDAEFAEKYLEAFGYVMVGSTPAQLEQYLAKDRALQAERIKISGAKLD